MKPWQAALLAYLIVGLVALELVGQAGGLIGLAAAAIAYWTQERKTHAHTR